MKLNFSIPPPIFRRSLRALTLVALCVTTVALPLPAAAQNLPSLGDTEREELSPLVERKLGEQVMHDIRRDRDYLDDAPLNEYLNNLGATLLVAKPEARGEAGYDFFFFAVRDPALNAFALPGGFIALHSALILAAQSESELAAVMAHEIGHVSQRHFARMLGKQNKDSLIPLAGLILAALAARSSPDASAALLLGGQGLNAQRQLGFGRDAEREADRVGLQMLKAAEFDTSGMIAFFGRMQNATRSYSDAVPAFLLSHPLTTERIADIQARTRDSRYKQRLDSIEFNLIKARVRILQDPSTQGLREATVFFEDQLQRKARHDGAAAKYGLALIAFRQRAYDKAQALLHEARTALPAPLPVAVATIFANLSIDIKLAAKAPEAALQEAKAAHAQFPQSRGIAAQYADALLAAQRYDEATRYLRDQTQLYRQEPHMHEKLAQTYAAQGKQALQHMSLSDAYALKGNLLPALDQLTIARRAPDATFYDQSVIDARERELKARWKELQQDSKS